MEPYSSIGEQIKRLRNAQETFRPRHERYKEHIFIAGIFFAIFFGLDLITGFEPAPPIYRMGWYAACDQCHTPHTPHGERPLGALSLSNGGHLSVAASAPFHLRGLFSPAALHVVAPCLQLSFGTVADRLCCTVSYPRPLVSDAKANAISDGLLARIAAGPGSTDRRSEG